MQTVRAVVHRPERRNPCVSACSSLLLLGLMLPSPAVAQRPVTAQAHECGDVEGLVSKHPYAYQTQAGYPLIDKPLIKATDSFCGPGRKEDAFSLDLGVGGSIHAPSYEALVEKEKRLRAIAVSKNEVPPDLVPAVAAMRRLIGWAKLNPHKE